MSLKKLIGLLWQDAYLGSFRKNKTSVVLVNNTTKTEDITVPAGEEWTVLSGRTHNNDNVARNCSVICYDSAAVETSTLHTDAALGAGANIQFPRANYAAAENPLHAPLVLEATDYVRFTFTAGGASAGGTSVIMLHVLVRKV